MTAGRRRWLVGAVGATAVVAGAGIAWWRGRAAQEAAKETEALWPLEFQTPQGSPLAMASLKGRPMLLNFWATWCPPCVEEMPLLEAFFRQNSPKGWTVVGLAIDQPSAVRTFLRKTPVSYPIGFAGLEGTELTRAMGNLTGGLPFSLVIGADGSVRQRRMGKLSEADLQAWSQLA